MFLINAYSYQFVLSFVSLFYQFAYKKGVFTSNTNHMLV